jgi:hypothetical protein
MLTFYCPKCWAIIDARIMICPECNYKIEEFDESPYEEKLLSALNHVVPERRIMAIQILGNLKSQKAIPEFLRLIQEQDLNYFLARAIILATIKIDHPLKKEIFRIAMNHPSTLISSYAKKIIAENQLFSDTPLWDPHTG